MDLGQVAACLVPVDFEVLRASVAPVIEAVGRVQRAIGSDNADVVTKSYRGFNPSFPHESTANQFFKEGQFEAYRRLGVELAMEAITYMGERMRQIECKSPKQLRDWLSSEFDDGEENTRETGTET